MAKLGIKAKAYRLTTGTRATWGTADDNGIHAGAAPSGLDEMTLVGEVTLTISKGEAIANVRGNNGWEAVLGALKKGNAEITSVYDEDDDHFAAMMGGLLNDTNVALALLSGDKATEGVQGLWADFQVVNLEKTEPEEGVQGAKWTVKPGLSAVAPEWVQVGGA